MYITAFETMDAAFAAAACRAYNDWLYDYIQAADPSRLFGAAAVSPHDVATAVTETRRAVTSLGMKAIFLRPNIVNQPMARSILRSLMGHLPGTKYSRWLP